jgi:hypothetical protein
VISVGDLVQCIWQPGTSRFVKGVGCIPMKYTIKGALGIITKCCDGADVDGGRWHVTFPQFGYTHTLSHSAFEVINETR